MTELSSQAQAVLDAAAQAMECDNEFFPYERELMAAALRAAAVYCTRERRILMTIAAELEGSNG